MCRPPVPLKGNTSSGLHQHPLLLSAYVVVLSAHSFFCQSRFLSPTSPVATSRSVPQQYTHFWSQFSVNLKQQFHNERLLLGTASSQPGIIIWRWHIHGQHVALVTCWSVQKGERHEKIRQKGKVGHTSLPRHRGTSFVYEAHQQRTASTARFTLKEKEKR